MACKEVRSDERRGVRSRMWFEATTSPEILEMFAELQGQVPHVPEERVILKREDRLEYVKRGDRSYQMMVSLDRVAHAAEKEKDDACVFLIPDCPMKPSCDGKNCLRIEMTAHERES